MAHPGRTGLHGFPLQGTGAAAAGLQGTLPLSSSPGSTTVLCSWHHHAPALLRPWGQEPNPGQSRSGKGAWKVGSQGHKKASQQDSQNKHTALVIICTSAELGSKRSHLVGRDLKCLAGTQAGPRRHTQAAPAQDGRNPSEGDAHVRLDKCRCSARECSERGRKVFSGCVNEGPLSLRLYHT